MLQRQAMLGAQHETSADLETFIEADGRFTRAPHAPVDHDPGKPRAQQAAAYICPLESSIIAEGCGPIRVRRGQIVDDLVFARELLTAQVNLVPLYWRNPAHVEPSTPA